MARTLAQFFSHNRTGFGRLRANNNCRIRPAILRLEDRTVPATINWTGGVDGNGTNWNDPANWNPTQVPGTSDDAKITVTGSNPTITVGNAEVNSIVATGRSLSIVGALAATTDHFDTCDIAFDGGTYTTKSSFWKFSNVTGSATFSNSGNLKLTGNSISIAIVNSGTVTTSGVNYIPVDNTNYFNAPFTNNGTLNAGYRDYMQSISTSPESIIRLKVTDFGSTILNVASAFVNHGSIIMQNSPYNTDTMYFNVSNGTMVNAADGIIRVPASYGGAASFSFSSLDNQGLIEINPVALFVTTPGSIAIGAGGTFDNHGTININGNTTVGLGTGAVFTNSGNITVLAYRTLFASLTNAAGGILTGNGTITGNVSGPGTITIPYDNATGTARLTVNGNVNLGGPLVVDLPIYNVGGAGLNVNGTVTLGGSLSFNVVGSVISGFTDTIINNDSTDAVNGTFAGLPQLSIFSIGPQWFQIDYKGGTGNDVTITCLPPRVQTVVINDGAVQRSKVTGVKVAFDNLVNFFVPAASAFELRRQSDNSLVELTASVANTSTQTTVTLTFSGALSQFGSLADGRYTLTAIASKINGGSFDGNGDGTPGDNYVLASSGTSGIFRLFGDADGNARVNAIDFAAFRSVIGQTGPSIFDFNGDDQTNASDFSEFRARFGLTLT